jgi:hypothetical protein
MTSLTAGIMRHVDMGVHVPGPEGLDAQPVGELLAGEPGALPHVVLPQAGVLDGRATRLLLEERSGLTGTGQVAGDEEGRIESRHDHGHRLGLPPPDLVEADVGVTLGAPLGVPRRAPMAHQDDPAASSRQVGGRVSAHGRRSRRPAAG